jgi:hypothetical protein
MQQGPSGNAGSDGLAGEPGQQVKYDFWNYFVVLSV